jgi:electron transfer flavoprotein alpha/beta subunit
MDAEPWQHIRTGGGELRIVIFVKQVPEADSVKVNPETGMIVREGVSSILNPFCEYALDEAFRIKNVTDEEVEIVAISMGPPQARSALLRCLELGADRAILLNDKSFVGSDCWATALVLERCIRNTIGDYDLILTGKQAIDGDTAQVPAELAEMLGIPQVTGCSTIEFTGEKILATREMENGKQVVRVAIPALISIGKGSNLRRFPSMADFLKARSKEMVVMGAKDLDINEESVGLRGSHTQVVRVFVPSRREGGVIVDGTNPEHAATLLVKFLEEKGFEPRRGGDQC